jgi:hypothetical protein
MLKVVLAALPLGVTVDGLKLQVAPVGRPLHAKLTCELKPFTGVTVMVVCAVAPAVTVPLVGDAPSVKLGTNACTVTVTVLEVDPEKFVSPE